MRSDRQLWLAVLVACLVLLPRAILLLVEPTFAAYIPLTALDALGIAGVRLTPIDVIGHSMLVYDLESAE